MDEARLAELREVLMGNAKLRAGSESVVTSILAELADYDDAAPSPPWLNAPELNVGEVRERLRWTLAEIAARQEQPPWS